MCSPVCREEGARNPPGKKPGKKGTTGLGFTIDIKIDIYMQTFINCGRVLVLVSPSPGFPFSRG